MNRKYKYEEYEIIWKFSKSSGNDLLLLLALVKFRQPKGMFATKETLANLMRCNTDTVDRSLKRLKALGELTWDKGSNHSRRANRYAILLPGLDLNTPLNAPLNSSEIPPYSHEEYPPSFTPLNSNETEIKLKESVSVFDVTRFGVLHLVSIEVSGLSPLKVEELLNSFASSFSCKSAYTEKIRLERWWIYLSGFAASQTKGDDVL